MELRRYFTIVSRRWLLVLVTVLAGVLAGYVSTPQTAVYTADATIYIGARNLSNPFLGNGLPSADSILALEQIVKTYASMINSVPIAQDALKRTGVPRSVDGLLSQTRALGQTDTQLLHVEVSDPDPAVAQELTNGLADSFVERISTLEPGAAPKPGDPPQLPAYVFARATLPAVPASIGLTRHLFLGGIFGLVAAVALCFLLDYLDVTIKSASDAERRLELTVLGVIPHERQFRRAPALPQLTRVT